MTQKIAVVIVAAGSGSRFGDPVPKQYHRIGDKTLLRHCVDRFRAITPLSLIQVVANPDHHHWYAQALGDITLTGDAGDNGNGANTAITNGAPTPQHLPAPVAGGATRQQSVLNGLRALAGQSPDIVLIHDAARPGISDDVIARVIDALGDVPGAIPTLPVLDTIKQADTGGVITATIPREMLHRAQTPQGFHFPVILAAHEQFEGREFTDDAALLEAMGQPVRCVAGATGNEKITRNDDIRRAHDWLAQPVAGSDDNQKKDDTIMHREEYRVGSGFDVHRFAPGDHCILCGVKVPHTARLDGHSDADVGLHTLTDAILGAIGAGDIGQHFPPSDMKWKGAASDQFVRHAVDLVRQRGGRIVNADITLICERPKIGPHSATMRQKVAEILEIDVDRVNVKATTTEKLGFTGREEGIAAQAVVSIALPA